MFIELAKEIIKPSTLWKPFPQIHQRSFWQQLDSGLKAKLIAAGEKALSLAYPTILATDFMEFSRNGNRTNYEKKLFARRTMLNDLVLAECIENQGRFLDFIMNGIFLIMEESAWQLPAHNSYVRDTPQLLLPDITRPVIDLFAAETGAVLTVTNYLLKPVLTQISPLISANLHATVLKRLIVPYLQQHFWWMGDGHSRMNNWTAWCTQNILIAAFLLPLSAELQKDIFHKACQSLDYFIAEYGTDGCCDEGAQYYRHAGLCLFNSLEVLNGVTGNGFSALYQNQKIQNIAAYILHAHIDDQYYVNFADCSPIAGRCSAREYLFGKRIGHHDLMAFAAKDYKKSEDPLILTEQNLFYRLQTVFTYAEIWHHQKTKQIIHSDIFYPSTGLFLVRDDSLYLAVKGGGNDDSHNHNDTGSFTIYKHGKPLFIDIGVESYTKKTFSSQRYEIWTMQSGYHNLPTFGDCMQKNGKEYKATNISYSLTELEGTITMDLAATYGNPNIHSYQRTASLVKGSHIQIEDIYQGTEELVILSLLVYEKPVLCGSTIQIGNLGSCTVTGISEVKTEIIPIHDIRLQQAWKHEIYRCLLTLEKHRLTLLIC